MRNFFVVTNSIKDPEMKFTNNIISFLESHGGHCTGQIQTRQTPEGSYIYADPEKVPAVTEYIIILGGDGTFIHVAKDLIDIQRPIIGINLGNLGYLTEIDSNNYEKDLIHISEGDFTVENRILLYGEIIRDGEVISSDIALNDIVLNRCQSMNIIDFEVNVNNKFLNRYSADGIIISTPTGSTGYNLSAGGPVVYPTAEIILATPICAHTLNSRSIAFSADSEIEIMVKERDREHNLQKIVSFDGESEILLQNNDIIRIRKSEKFTKIIRSNDISFVEHLGKKMR